MNNNFNILLLGEIITVDVDRPIGIQVNSIKYPINCGVINGVDVYIIGEDKPLKEFTGKVIAVLYGKDNTVKLVASPKSKKYNQAEIIEAVYFKEKDKNIEITNLYHKSCGAIIYRYINERLEYLLLFQRNSKTWSFPKGHAVAFESEKQTALREVKEEIGLTVILDDNFRETIRYPLTHNGEKEVVLFLSEKSDIITLQESEIEEYIWADRKTASKLLKHKAYVEILEKADNIITKEENYV